MGRDAVDGSMREIVNEYAACGCAVVQRNLDGGMTPWYGVGGIVPISLEMQRTGSWMLNELCFELVPQKKGPR